MMTGRGSSCRNGRLRFPRLLCDVLAPCLLTSLARCFALASQQSQRASVALNAEEMSKAIPFLVRPEKLDGSLPGDMGFDPMRL